MKKSILIIVSLILIVIGIIIIYMNTTTNNNINLVEYASDLLEYNLRSCVSESNGTLISNPEEEDYLYAEFIINKDKEKEVRDWISNKANILNESMINSNIEYAQRNKNSSMKHSPAEFKVEYIYRQMMTGKIAKTRDIRVYLCTDNSGVMYLYIYG